MQRRLEKFTFRSFKNKDLGYVFFMVPNYKQYLIEETLFVLFKEDVEFKMPYIVYMLENGDFVTYEHLQPKKLYYVFISESQDRGIPLNENFKFSDLQQSSELFIFSEKQYSQLVYGPNFITIQNNIDQMIEGIEKDMTELQQQHEQFEMSCKQRRQIIYEQKQAVEQKIDQVKEFSNYINWTYEKYGDLTNQMIKLLKENDITILDPVFGNDIQQKEQLSILNKKKNIKQQN